MKRSDTYDKLTIKQQMFVDEYLVDLNATQASIRAKYSKKTAATIGSENLQKPYIQAAIAERRAQIADSTAITPERVLAEMGRLAFSDLRKMLDEKGNLKAVSDWDDDTAASIASLETGVGGIAKVKAWDKNSALEKIAKHLGMFEPEKQSSEIHVHLHDLADKF